MMTYTRFLANHAVAVLSRSLPALLLLTGWAQAQTTAPTISGQPRNQSVSLGANVTFRVSAAGTPPLQFQWRQNEAVIESATNAALVLTNVTAAEEGNYSVIVSNDAGFAASGPGTLTIDPTFTKITTGLIATEGGDSSGCAWGDFDNDGFPDLFVGNGSSRNFLYRNKGDGTFEKLTSAVPASVGGYGGSWGDFDNDG